MGICRASRYKRRASGGKRAIHQKKRKYELGRPAANTKLGGFRVHAVRCRGGMIKRRALRLDHGCFSWTSECTTQKTKIISTMYNPTSNELVRTNTLTKGTIVQVDATPFKAWYYKTYGIELGRQGQYTEEEVDEETKKARAAKAEKMLPLPQDFQDQFNSGRLLACISSRPGQHGVANGYLLERKELDFYKRKLDKKKR